MQGDILVRANQPLFFSAKIHGYEKISRKTPLISETFNENNND